MNENEFDIYVRNLVAGAEESFSPDVWKGVEAGLDKAARRRVVPVWLWRGLAAASVAAAVAAGFVLLRPDKNLSNQPNIPTNPVALATTDAPLPAENQPEEEIVVPIDRQVARLQGKTAYVPEIQVSETVEEEPAPVPAATEEPERKPDTIGAPASGQDAVTSDEEAFNRLAFEEHKTRRHGSFSMNVMGNVQSNTRPESPASTIRRTSPLFVTPAPTQTGLYDERPEFSFGLPVSAGIGFRYHFNPRWSIGTGIVYTNLSRSFMANYFEVDGDTVTKRLYDTDVTNQQHYIGIPLNLYFNIVNTGAWNFHVRMDGMAEKLVDNHFLIHDSEGDIHFHQKVDRPQLSAGIGIGAEFQFTPHLGLYLDPTLRYYFDCGQPRSLRTISPLRLDFEVGLRFSLGQ